MRKRVLITIRTYPTPSRRTVEASCTAGITEEGEWIRLYPLNYRLLRNNQKFHKFQWIEVDLVRATNDNRPESHKLDTETLTVESAVIAQWPERERWLAPLRSASFCALKAERDLNHFPTLGLFRPKTIVRLKIERESPGWSESDLAKLRQLHMFAKDPPQELEKIPFKFVYTFTCDDPSCPTHNFSCFDWEMAESYRVWRTRYEDDGWQVKFRETYEREMIEKYDTQFFVGNFAQHQANWGIVGILRSPPGIANQLRMF